MLAAVQSTPRCKAADIESETQEIQGTKTDTLSGGCQYHPFKIHGLSAEHNLVDIWRNLSHKQQPRVTQTVTNVTNVDTYIPKTFCLPDSTRIEPTKPKRVAGV